MAYPIKNTNATQTNSLMKASFAIGVNQGGYGLTSSTAFWNGKTPNIGGYVTYVGNGTSSPTMYTSLDDTELINLSNQLGGMGSITTIGDALSFLNFGNYKCVNIDCPNIVTSGLTLYLDAGYTVSYPKSTTAWNDLSGNIYNFTLLNGVTYSYPGVLYLDGSNDAIQLTGNTALKSTKTVVVWLSTTKTQGIFLTGEVPPATGGYFLGGYYPSGSVFIYSNCGSSITSYVDCNVITNPNLYLDGNYHMWEFKNVDFSSWTNVWNWGGYSASWQLGGNLVSITMYDRNLTAQESLQNYYAGLQKFIPDTIILCIDGENTNTRVITPTTAYDSSSFNYNGSLMNGMGLSHRNAGTSFSFDGVNNYIDLGSPYRISISTGYLTVSVWFKLTTTPVGSNTIIKFGAANNGWLIGVSSSSLYYSLYTTTTNFIGGSSSISLNVWHNVTFTFNGSGTFIMYLDGVVVATSTSTAGGITYGSSAVVNIGRDGSTNTNYFKGTMSIVRIFADTLTAAQVLTIYTAGKGRHNL